MQKGSIMEEFTPIYRILQILKKAMDVEEFEKELISSEAIKVNYPKVELTRPEITLKGLEYLEENSMMKKVSKVAKGLQMFLHKINMMIKEDEKPELEKEKQSSDA